MKEKNKPTSRPILRRRIFVGSFLLCLAVIALMTAVAALLFHQNVAAAAAAEPKTLLFLLLGGIFLSILLSLGLSTLLAKLLTAPFRRLDPANPHEGEIYEELTPLVDHIETQNDQLVRQMQDLKAEHEKQDAMRRDFTANVSHELKTPLTSISGYAEIIRGGIARAEDVPRFAGKIYDDSRRLITLVGDIIRLSQLDGQDLRVESGPVDLYRVCEEVLSGLEMAAEKRQITLSLQGEQGKTMQNSSQQSNALLINGSEQVVEEIVFNLTDNAVKYNREGGSVTLTLEKTDDGVQLTVADTGIGIPPEDLDRVFERFYRVDKSHSREIGGTGLGLSIVKHGALHLGAKLTLQSEVSVGTTVYVVFPEANIPGKER